MQYYSLFYLSDIAFLSVASFSCDARLGKVKTGKVHCLIKEDQFKNNNIFKRHPCNGPNIERSFAGKRGIDFSAQNLGSVINFKKSQPTPVSEIEVLGSVINSVNTTFALPQEKVWDTQNKCMQLIASPNITIMELTKLLGKFLFTSQAVLPGRIQGRYLQQQIQAVTETNSYQVKIKLSQQSLTELKRWKATH